MTIPLYTPRRHVFEQFIRRLFDVSDSLRPQNIWKRLGVTVRDVNMVQNILKHLVEIGYIEKIAKGQYRRAGTGPNQGAVTRAELSAMPAMEGLENIPEPVHIRDKVLTALQAMGPSTVHAIRAYIKANHHTDHRYRDISTCLARLIANGRVTRDGAIYKIVS